MNGFEQSPELRTLLENVPKKNRAALFLLLCHAREMLLDLMKEDDDEQSANL